jgi:hypothetical protein
MPRRAPGLAAQQRHQIGARKVVQRGSARFVYYELKEAGVDTGTHAALMLGTRALSGSRRCERSTPA